MTAAVTRIPVACPNCGADMGEMVNTPKGIVLDDGRMFVRVGSAFCRCGKQFHWRQPSRDWGDLVARHISSAPVLDEEASR